MNPAIHGYRAYGLAIGSELHLPELPADERYMGDDSGEASLCDVNIRLGATPEHVDEFRTSSPTHEASAEHLLLRIDGVARYLVSHGRQITVDPDAAASEHDVRVFLLGTCFGALLHQRGLLVLHASGIRTAVRAALFAGPSGAGKSTLLGELLRRGYAMTVDDVAAVRVDGSGQPILLPSYPRTRMWSDAAERFGIETSGLQRTRSHMDKYERQVWDQFSADEAPLRRIYHLAGSNGDEMSVTPLEPLAVIPTLVANTYRRVLLDGLAMRRSHFDLASQVARTVPVRRVIRPDDPLRLPELADLIVTDLHT